MTYYSFSKPVFFQSYKYAFVYSERGSIYGAMVGGSTSFVFFEKGADGEWKVIFVQALVTT
jgi:hypothetical protein